MNACQDMGFVLHGLAWRETSLIVDVITRQCGRLGLIAKGARRPRSALRGLLQPFQPLDLRWSGQSELRILTAAEWVGGVPSLRGAALMPGFYINELIIRLLPREDAHPALFDDYLETMRLLGQVADGDTTEFTEPVLRRFEANLLRELGVSPDFSRDMLDASAVRSDGIYEVSPIAGVRRMGGRRARVEEPDAQPHPSAEAVQEVHGRTLLALAQAGGPIEDAVHALSDPEVASESKRLLRELLGHHLGDAGLHSRQVMRELVRI